MFYAPLPIFEKPDVASGQPTKGATPEVRMEALGNEMCCPVCLELFTYPLLLPCAHNLCRGCAEDILASPPDQYYKNSASGKSEPEPEVEDLDEAGRGFCCPTCRERIVLGDKGLDGLRKNATLQSIVDRYKQATSEARRTVGSYGSEPNSQVLCDSCEDDPKPAFKTCKTCEVSFCPECLEAHHSHPKIFAKHVLVAPTGVIPHKLTDTRDKEEIVCTEHRDEKVNLYCREDNKLVCTICRLVGKHKDHELAAVDEMFKELREKLILNVDALEKRTEGMIDQVSSLRTQCQDIESTGHRYKQRLYMDIDELIRVLEEKKVLLGEKIDTEREMKVQAMEEQVDDALAMVEQAKRSLFFARELIKEKDCSAFLMSAAEINERIQKAMTPLPGQCVGAAQFMHTVVDMRELGEQLKGMKFMKVPSAPVILANYCKVTNVSFTLHWLNKERDFIDSYQVLYCESSVEDDGYGLTAGGMPSAQSQWKTDDGITEDHHTVYGLQPDTEYTMFVRGISQAGCTERSQLINVKTHKGLRFQLDPDSAHRLLLLSNGNMSIKCDVNGRRSITAHKDRFNGLSTAALGNISIRCGQHYWECDVRDCASYRVGVAYFDMPRAKLIGGSESSWVFHRSGCISSAITGDVKHNVPQCSPNVLGVFLDYDKGLLSFLDVEREEHIYTFQTKFLQPVYPAVALLSLDGSMALHADKVVPEQQFPQIEADYGGFTTKAGLVAYGPSAYALVPVQKR
ncbi:E3 ubiquitin-protein ligase Midline-1-like isoform X1 [Branchiostoma lanceolatum]|uniref:E3 ubiquitin-protein ligase Midline-1-like isoform X1 n=2 Tax=Branchiostoma lanceolatum TaxID=7740 RepID=UPI003456B9F8